MENMMMPKMFIEEFREKILLLIWEWKLVIGSEFWKWSEKAPVMMKLSIKWPINSEIIMP